MLFADWEWPTVLHRFIAEWSWQEPRGGSVLWIRLPPGTDARVYAQLALRHGAEVIPGDAMDPSGAHDDHLRLPLSFAAPTATELVDRLSAAWAALPRSRAAGGPPRPAGGTPNG
ncbi:hypothetical protein PL81_07715 [Streptomyces sp. RSD-27]|nr:hypothetical protein PL81_07715 [Streptomyces sp. RSD-27]